MMRRILLSVLILSICVLLAIGCSKKGSDVVATIDGESLPVSLLDNYFAQRDQQFDSYDDELAARKMALDSLIAYKLLVQGAYDAGLDANKEVNRVVSSERANFLFDELYRREILPHTEVSDRDYDQFRDKMKTEYRFSHILVPTKAIADSLYEQIQEGADFGMLARTRSIDQSSAVKGGDLGFLSWAVRLEEPFRDAAFNLKVGEVSKPVQTSYGWHIIKNTETRDAELPDTIPQLEGMIKDIIKQRRAGQAELELWKQMEDEAHVEINTKATDMLLKKLAEHYPDTINGAARPDNFFPNLDLLDQSQRDMVFASYTGGEVTVEEYLRKIADVPEFYRPNFADKDSLQGVVFQLELSNIMEFEALKRKLDETPEYQERVKKYKESVMADQFVRQYINTNISVDPEEMEEYYNTHLDEFMTEPKFHLLEIEHDSLDTLKSLLRQINQGADFGKLAAKYTMRAGYKEKGGDLGVISSVKYPAIYRAVKNMGAGDIAPFTQNAEGRWSLLKVVDVEQPQVRPFEEVQRLVRQKIFAKKRDRATEDWVNAKKQTMVIKINEDVLENSIDRSKYAQS